MTTDQKPFAWPPGVPELRVDEVKGQFPAISTWIGELRWAYALGARRGYEAGLEAAAKVCDDKARRNFPWASENSDRYHAQADWAAHCAAAIRQLKGKQ